MTATAPQATVRRAILWACAVAVAVAAVAAVATAVGSGRVEAAPGIERRADGIRLALDGRYLTIQLKTEAIVRVLYSDAVDPRVNDLVVTGPRNSLGARSARRVPNWKLETSATVATLSTAKLRVNVKLADGTWLIGDHVDANVFDYHESEFYLSEVRWLKLDMPKVQTKGTLLDKVDLSKVDAVGFADLTPGSGHGTGGYSDVAWIEVYGKPVKRDTASQSN